MALPAAGQPISFGDINDELGNSGNRTLDLKANLRKNLVKMTHLEWTNCRINNDGSISIKYLVQQGTR